MENENRDDPQLYKVVVNQEDQYSIWPVTTSTPSGWREVGISGIKEECLLYIEEVWKDMRPHSLRKKLDTPKLG